MILTIFFVFSAFLTAVSALDPNADDDHDSMDCNYDGKIDHREEYPNKAEFENNTNPKNPDSDGDGMWDVWEIYYGFDPNDPSDASQDADGDGKTNLEEFNDHTNPRDVDMDHDGMPDVWEDIHGLNSSDPSDAGEDPDDDGLTNLEEFGNQTDPHNPDSDGDGMPDGWEVLHHLNPSNSGDAGIDTDNGGVNNLGEYRNSTDPQNGTDDYGNAGGGNGGEGIPTGIGVPPDTGRTDTSVTLIHVFEPELREFKRWQSLDGLSSHYLLYLRNETRTPISPSSGDYRYVYYGALNVSFSPGEYIRLPSPSPDSVLLDYYFSPSQIQFFRDGADNYYAHCNLQAEGTLYFTFGTNGSYFNLSIPENLTTTDEPPDLLPPISSNVRESVGWFLNSSDDPGIRNLRNESRLLPIINNLTAYFSNFTEGEGDVPDPQDGQDIYQAIAINKVGACRHRAFAFFVTANALGVPTRYISNEVHAFVEVYIPNGSLSASNWHRIDLGGAGTIGGEEERPPAPPASMESVIHLNPIPVRLYMGVPFTLTGNITSLNGTPLAHYPFSVFAGSYRVGEGASDSQGNISLNLTLMSLSPGNYTLALQSLNYNGFSSNTSEGRVFEFYSDVRFHPALPSSMGKGEDLYCAGFLSLVNDEVLRGEDISLYYDGTLQDTDTTTDMGEYNLSLSIPADETEGSHTLSLRFSGHDHLLDGYYNTTITVMGRRVALEASVQPPKQDAGLSITVTGSAVDENGDNVSDKGRLLISLHGMELLNDSLSRYTDAEGRNFSVSLTLPATLGKGNYTLYVGFLSEVASLPDASRNLNLEVDRISTEIYLYQGEANIGELFTINGTLYSKSGIHVPGSVELYWDGNYLDTVTVDENGDFSYEYITRHSPGLVAVRAVYRGSTMFSPSQAEVDYHVFSYTSFDFTPHPEEGVVYRNTTIRVSGRLLDDNSRNVEGVTIYLYANDNLANSTTTDDWGFSFRYYLSPDMTPGQVKLEILFRGAGYYRATSASLYYNISARTVITILRITNPVQAGTNFTLNGTFLDDMGHPVDSSLSLIFLGEKHTLTPENGTFSAVIPIPLSRASGSYNLTVEFQAINNYEDSQATAMVTVFHLTNLTAIPYNLTRGSNGLFEGYIKDELGNGIPGLEMSIYLSGEFLGTTGTSFSGHFVQSILLPGDLPLRNGTVRLLFNGTPYYRPSEVNYTAGIFASTNLTIHAVSPAVRDELDISLSLTDNLGNPLSDMEILLNFGTLHYAITTNENGEYTASSSADIPVGSYSFSAVFPGSGFYLQSMNAVSVDVVSPLSISVDYMNGAVAGENFIISGEVKDDRNEPVNSALNFTLTGSEGRLVKQSMAINGVFNLSWALPASLKPGDYAIYINDSLPYPQSYYLSSSFFRSVHLKRATLIQTEILPDGYGVRGSSVTIYGNLTDAMGNSLPFSQVIIQLNGGKYSLITNSRGDFYLDYMIPKNQSVGPMPYTCTYPGNESYLGTTLRDFVRVFSQTNVYMEGKTMHWNDVVVSGVVKDNLGVVVTGPVNIYIDGSLTASQVYSGVKGFSKTLSYPHVGVFPVRVEFLTTGYYLGSNESVDFTLYSFITIDYVFNSTLSGSQKIHFANIKNPVLAGDGFTLTLNVGTDLNEDIDYQLMVGFYNQYRKLTHYALTDPAGPEVINFDAPLSMPPSTYYVNITDNKHDTLHVLNREPYLIDVNVMQSTYIQPIVEQENGILFINLTVRDGYGRAVGTGKLNGTMDGHFIKLIFVSGVYHYSKDVANIFGTENFSFVYPMNDLYLGSEKNLTIHIRAFTVLTLSVPEALHYGEEFEGYVYLTLRNSKPIYGAMITLKMDGDTMTVITGEDGKAKFRGQMDENRSVTVSAEFAGDSRYYPSQASEVMKFKSESSSLITLSTFASGRAILVYVLVAGAGIYIWRRKQLSYIMELVHDTTLKLEEGGDPKSVIITAYNLMCRHLRRYNLTRRHYETVEEFKEGVRRALQLSENGIGSLTSVFELADYSIKGVGEEEKKRAIQSLRMVERELAGMKRGAGG